MTSSLATRALACGLAVLVAAPALTQESAQLSAETPRAATLGTPGAHWLLVKDIAADRIFLFDADSGRTLGTISTGYSAGAVEFAPDFSAIYLPETSYPRPFRGERTDLVTVIETQGLTASDEVVIPAKRGTGVDHRTYNGLSDDGRWMYVVNMTPTMSVSVVDVAARRFVAEHQTPGCTMVLPTGDSSLALLCGDGSLLHLQLDDEGAVTSRERTQPFFSPADDPVRELGVRLGDTWYLTSFHGTVYPVRVRRGALELGSAWRLSSDAELAAGWRPAGNQFAAGHAGLQRLYFVMNQAGDGGHKDPGNELWVFDARNGTRLQRLRLYEPAGRVVVSQDDDPVAVVDGAGSSLFVLDARTGALRNVIDGPLLGAGILQFVPAR
ncbi:MAG: amine dehydrogenase large subunit [Pseudomonadales bacterium]